MQNELSKQIISSFAEIAHEKGIDRDMLLSILEDVFRTMIRKKYETDDAFEVILNADRGEIQILHVQACFLFFLMKHPEAFIWPILRFHLISCL